VPEPPDVPHGVRAFALIADKVWERLPGLLLYLLTGPRALWIGTLAVWVLITRPPRALRVAAWAALALGGAAVIAAAAGLPGTRAVFPARIMLETAGVLAAWGLIAFIPEPSLSTKAKRVVHVAIALLVVGWGAFQTSRGNAEARRAVERRGVPEVSVLRELSGLMSRDMPRGTPVMSNLGPALAWYANRPVIHLALTPDDVAACRHHIEFNRILLVFRDAEHAWNGWDAVIARPEEATHRPEWNITAVRSGRTADGFQVVMLELGPPGLRMAALPDAEPTVRR
jgi:hypothetical protein